MLVAGSRRPRACYGNSSRLPRPRPRNSEYAAVLSFAREWGPLHLCHEHARPAWHTLDTRNAPFGHPITPFCPPATACGWKLCRVGVGMARPTRRPARDVVRASALLRAGKAQPATRRERQLADVLRVKPERDALTLRVQTWLEDGVGVTLLPKWPRDESTSRMESGSPHPRCGARGGVMECPPRVAGHGHLRALSPAVRDPSAEPALLRSTRVPEANASGWTRHGVRGRRKPPLPDPEYTI